MSPDASFATELTAFIPRLRAFGRTLSGAQAEGDDLAQETVLRAWAARSSFVVGTNMEAWLFRLLRNQHISSIRSGRRRPVTTMDGHANSIASADDPGARLAFDEVRLALNHLPADQREALILVGASGMSYEEAARAAGCPVGTIKSRVFRARRALTEALDHGRPSPDGLPSDGALGTGRQFNGAVGGR